MKWHVGAAKRKTDDDRTIFDINRTILYHFHQRLGDAFFLHLDRTLFALCCTEAFRFPGNAVPFCSISEIALQSPGSEEKRPSGGVETGILYSRSAQVVDWEMSSFFQGTEVQKFPVLGVGVDAIKAR
ncbi:MAG: hypothetical protein JWM16_2741 [Verrucomicrobiales bacterium]|nr:hypothetical protein [Verrucomicrobiales bacterium]